MENTLLRVENLSKRFGGVEAVAGVSFHVERGEIYSLIGPNGAGKTSTFNMISSVVRPSGGTVHFDGRDITGIAPHRLSAAGIGRTFQNLAVFKHATVVQNLLV